MTKLSDKELMELETRLWERISIKLTHADILMFIPIVEEVLDKCNCGKKKPPKK